MKIKGAVLREPNKPYSIEELELEPPKEKEVLVRYAYTGYCHSDLHNLLGEIQMALPLVAGHEAALLPRSPGTIPIVPGERRRRHAARVRRSLLLSTGGHL